eukprot:TRINITY_DN5823_c0_g1_i1.p1 TRINITY_DN5823_c0_g1~~TRINITY_DN5823_c0_g1_i1.p1  ORF type:complete len:520 (+),score=87.80 TRINITY_DN5823_c0_g1_i1:52-1611(+)
MSLDPHPPHKRGRSDQHHEHHEHHDHHDRQNQHRFLCSQATAADEAKSDGCVLPLSDAATIERFAYHTTRIGAANGVVFLPPKSAAPLPATYVSVPYALFPSPFPREQFRNALALAPLFTRVVLHASRDVEFLHAALATVARADEFTQRLLKIHQQVLEEGISQRITVGILRSDYMLQESAGEYSIRQVEINTIASSFGCLGTHVSDAHRYAVSYENLKPFSDYEQPVNHARHNIAEVLGKASKLYGQPNCVVVMIVQPNERNAIDQWFIEHDLWAKHHVKLMRCTLHDIATRGSFEPNTKRLLIDGHQVSVVYFRAGYTPVDYPTEQEWDARVMIERSEAIKCPNIAVHLVGAKKFQQVLAQPGVLERYLHKEDVPLVKSCFAGLWSLQEGEGEEILKLAAMNPEHYVLKPQREGGGNNIYGEELRKMVTTCSREELESYILMERLYPPYVPGYYVREGEIRRANLVAELGIFGMFISNDADFIHNEVGGFLLRSKAAENEDGGVAAGVAVLDSVFLV